MQCEFQSLSTSEDIHLSSRSDVTFPIKCFAQTKILYETKSVQRFIDPLIGGFCSNITIPVMIKDNCLYLKIGLRNNFEDIVEFNVALGDEAFKESSTLICEMSVMNNAGQLIHSFEGKHSFIAKNVEVWCLATHINKTHFKTYLSDSSSNKIILNANFVIFFGQTISEIVSVERIRVSRNVEPSNEYEPSTEMFHLYKENELCDFALKVGDEIFNVHKVVLGAASPVFKAMFKNDMEEKLNSLVDIVDLDKATVQEMVSFMYTGSLKKLEYDNAKKLFIAGDKYQISPLLDLTRNVMINLINIDNICDILSLADTYNDVKLKKEAQKFIKLNKITILNSTKWATFEKENANLAAKILRQVCLLNKRRRLS